MCKKTKPQTVIMVISLWFQVVSDLIAAQWEMSKSNLCVHGFWIHTAKKRKL